MKYLVLHRAACLISRGFCSKIEQQHHGHTAVASGRTHHPKHKNAMKKSHAGMSIAYTNSADVVFAGGMIPSPSSRHGDGTDAITIW